MSSKDAEMMSASEYASTIYLFANAANAARLQAAMAEADASLPVGARILGPTGSPPECHIVE
jgi:antitoxin YefM